MIKRTLFIFFFTVLCFASVSSQVPINVGVQILKAEDERRYDKTLEDLMRSPSSDIRKRAALAAGRIGKDEAITALVRLLESDSNQDVQVIAAFAIGEIESTQGADAILKTLSDSSTPSELRARAVEADGKIAAANPKSDRSKELGGAIL